MNTHRKSSIIFLFVLCIAMLFSVPMLAQQRDTQKEYNIDSTLYDYYLLCKAELHSPKVLYMTDTLFEMASKIDDKRMQAVALCYKLDYHYFKGVDEDSIRHYTNVVKQFSKETNQLKYYYFVWGSRLINYFIKCNKFNIALYEANEMRKSAEKDNYTQGIAGSYNVLSNIYQSKVMWQMAIECKKKEIDIILKYDLDSYNLGSAYLSLVTLYCDLGEPAEAYKYLEMSASWLYSSVQEFSYFTRSAIYYLTIADYDKALEYLDKAKKLLDEEKEVQRDAARYYDVLQMYYSKTKQYSKALETMNFISDNFGYTANSMIHDLFDRANIYYEMGDMTNSARYFKRFNELSDSMKISNEGVAASEFQAILGVEGLKLETSELQQQLQRRDLKNKKRIILILVVLLAMLLLFFSQERRLNKRLRNSRKQLKAKNNELVVYQEDLEIAKEQAESGSIMKSTFIQNMSHEIRTPLNSIVGFAQILSGYYGDNEETNEYAAIIEQNSNTLLQLVNDVLDLSYLDSERDIPAETITNISGVCQTCIDQVRVRVKPDVKLIFENGLVDYTMQTSPNRVSQILTNLLQNAAKFTVEGSITLSFNVNENNKTVVMMVTDTGIGIPRDKHEEVFERFSKLDSFTPGTGLGLSISRLIAEKMGGSLTIDPEYVNGCRFVLVLPLNL